jgi:thiazole synthase ThiGH ThiG subunit
VSVPTVCRCLDVTAKLQPVVVDAPIGDPLGAVAGFPVGCQYFLAVIRLLVEERGTLGC